MVSTYPFPFLMDTPAPAAAGPALLGQLLSETTQYIKAHWQPLALGAVVLGIVLGLMQMYLGAATAVTIEQNLDQFNIDVERMEELSGRIEAGDEAALDELEALLEGSVGGMNQDQMRAAGLGMFRSLMPAIGLSVIVSMLLGFLAHAYYSLIAVEGKDLSATLGRTGKVLLPLAGVSLWAFIRSFAWIPVIGIIPAIILGPRFIAAPLIYLTEGKGIMASVSDSYRRTRGYWPKIAGNMIVAVLIFIVAAMITNTVLGIALMAFEPVLFVLNQIVGQLFVAFTTVFAIRLAHTILQHPRA